MATFILPVKDFSDRHSASLSVLEFTDLPWSPKRLYWLQNFKTGASRGNHAHKKLSQVFVMVRGSLVLDLYRGQSHERILFTTESGQILIEPGTWRVISTASVDALLLVAASERYDEEDYIRDWKNYLDWFNEEFPNA